jgi:hypothetical protein
MSGSPADTTAHRVHRELMDDAVLGRPNFDAFELVLRRDSSFGQLGDLCLNFAQLARDLAAQILIDLTRAAASQAIPDPRALDPDASANG